MTINSSGFSLELFLGHRGSLKNVSMLNASGISLKDMDKICQKLIITKHSKDLKVLASFGMNHMLTDSMPTEDKHVKYACYG